MTEQMRPHEQESSTSPILALAREMGTLFTDESEELLKVFKPRMSEEEKTQAFGELHDSLQKTEDEAPEAEIPVQLHRQIGIVLATAHAHYASESTWPVMSEELWTAYDMADQNAESYEGFAETKETIYKLLYDLAQKQHRV